MGKHTAPRKRSPWPAMSVALVLVMSTGAAPPREAPTSPAAAQEAPARAEAIQAAPVALAYERPSVATQAAPAPAPPPPPRFAGMGLTRFQAAYEGRRVILPGYSTAECMAVFSGYHYASVRGRPYSSPGAKDLWPQAWTEYEKIPASAPTQPGDVAVWSGSFGAYQGGGWGHVAIVLADHGGTITALSQNPTPTAVMELSKSGLLGYLRPRQLNP
jgi:hypothetical protein